MHDIYATAYHPPDLEMLRRYNVNRGMGDIGQIRNGGFRGRRFAARRAAATLTTEQRIAQDNVARFKAELWRGKSGTRNFAVTPLSTEGKQLQAAILARDWDALFGLTGGVNNWVPRAGQHAPSLGKYSFVIENGRRRYIPFTEDEIRSFIFSRHYRVKPGHVCSDPQKESGVQAHWNKTQRHIAKYRDASNPLHIWPILPGWGYPGQTFMCQPVKKSLWVKIRKPLAIAVGVVAAVWLGPIVIGKIAGAGAAEVAGGTAAAGASSGGAAAAGIVGAGAKAGAAVAITTKGAVTAALTTKATITGAAALATVKTVSAATLISGAAEAGTLFTKVQNVTTWVNRARSVDAIIKGELPPPPIGISGSNFTEWAMALAKEEVKKEIGEQAGEYISKRAQEKYEKEQEAMMRAEIEKMQAELAALVSANTPIAPAPEIDAPVRDKIIEMQNIEKQRATNTMIMLAVGGGAAMLMLG